MITTDHQAPLLILGCHRSGTSAVTGLLESAGLHLGETLPPTAANPMGYFESAPIVMAHNLILSELDRDWTCPPPEFDPSAVPTDLLTDEVTRLRASDLTWGVKDPRLLFMLPAWTESVERFRFVGVIRKPAEIVKSIVKRDQIPLEAAGQVADAYIERLARLHELLGFPIIDFSTGPAELFTSVHRVADELSLEWDTDKASAFLKPSLIHYTSPYRDANRFSMALAEAAEAGFTDVPTFSSTEVDAALQAIAQDSPPYLGTNFGPRFSQRRRALWKRVVDDAELERVVELIPAATPPREIRPAAIAAVAAVFESSGDVARVLARHPAATHVLSAGLTEATPPSQIERLFRDLAMSSRPFAVVGLDGFFSDDDPETIVWPTSLFVTSRSEAPYHHTREEVERALERTGWRIRSFDQSNGGRSVLLIFRDPALDAADPTRSNLALLALDARVSRIERDAFNAPADPARTAPATGSQTRSGGPDDAVSLTELEKAQDALANAQAKYDRLLSRRSVAFALKLADLTKPFVRRFRR